jgi:hypothetical protein
MNTVSDDIPMVGKHTLAKYQQAVQFDVERRDTYQDMNATMKPSHENINTRPYLSNGLNNGTDLAFRFMGLISGAAKKVS